MVLYYAQYLVGFALAWLSGMWLGGAAFEGRRAHTALAFAAVPLSILATALVSAQLVRGCP